MAKKDGRRAYRSFLMRMWQNGDRAWLFSLEDTVSGSRKGFSSLGKLMDFLLDLIRFGDQPEEDNLECE